MGGRATDLGDREVLVEASGGGKWDKPGEYTISYSATDAAGNAADAVARTVNVVDTTGPVIVINGEASVTHEAGSVYKDSGARATDLVDGEVSVESGGSVKWKKPGEYTISYSATDSAGNKGKGVERKVNVVDTTGPVIVLNGEATITHEAGGVYKDLGAVATALLTRAALVPVSGSVESV